ASTNALRARVVTVHDAGATTAFVPDAQVVRRMVDQGLAAFTGKPEAGDAWRTLVTPKDVVGFKVTAAPGAVSGTRPATVQALIESLLSAGHPTNQIVIWDKRDVDLRAAGWRQLAQRLGVRCVASENAGWDEAKFYDSPLIGRLVVGDLEFGRKEEDHTGRKSYVSRLLTHDLTKIITVAPVLSHNVSGVNGHLAGLAWASVDNTIRFANDSARLAEAVPDICGLDDVIPKLVLAVSDALICQYRGEEETLLHYTIPLNELRFSKDPVALDVLALADVEHAREAARLEGERKMKFELYSNAELIELGVADPKRIDVVHIP
ncbi:MAG TPA: hypothetical protein VMB21_02685, partial [Candidatus Limnocylindria bacterium]|nr:hypothetical protein [Candidatus Limnocylindria bacterium]